MDGSPVQLYYETFYSGLPVVLIHGYPLNHTTWEPVIKLMDKSGARIIAPDLRGFGQSPAITGIYKMEAMAEDILALLNQLGIQKAILVGHSMGGYICLAFARLYPNRLAGLGLVASKAAGDTPEGRQARIKTASEVQRHGVKVVAQSMPAKLTSDPDLAKRLYEMILKTSPSAIIGSLKGMAERMDSIELLSQIKVPVVVIAGRKDSIVTQEQSRLMSQLFYRAWLVEVEEAGHMTMMEAPAKVAEAISQLVQKVKVL